MAINADIDAGTIENLNSTEIAAVDIHGTTLAISTIDANTIAVSALHEQSGAGITVQGSLAPSTDNMYNIGTVALRFKDTHCLNNYEPATNAGTNFTIAATSAASGVTATAPLTIANAQYDGGSNTFKFPQKGYYTMSFNTDWVGIGLLANKFELFLYQTNTSTVLATHTHTQKRRGMHL